MTNPSPDLPRTSITDFAYEIIELSESRDFWRRQAEHYQHLYEMHSKMTSDSIEHSQELMGTVLLAALDPDSRLNRATRALERDPMKGAMA